MKQIWWKFRWMHKMLKFFLWCIINMFFFSIESPKCCHQLYKLVRHNCRKVKEIISYNITDMHLQLHLELYEYIFIFILIIVTITFLNIFILSWHGNISRDKFKNTSINNNAMLITVFTHQKNTIASMFSKFST